MTASQSSTRTASLLVVLVGYVLLLPLLVAPALSRGEFSSAIWSIREGGPGMLVLIPLGLGVSTVLVMIAVLRGRGLVYLLSLSLPVALPLAGWGFYRLGMGKAFSAIGGASVEPMQKLRILAEGASEAGNLLSLSAFLGAATAFVTAAFAAASAIDLSPRLAFGKRTLAGIALGGIALVGGLLTAGQHSSETWHWLQGALVVLFGTPLVLVAFAAIDGAASVSDAPPPALHTSTVVALFALSAALVSAYFAVRNEITNVMFSAIGGETIDPSRREEILRAGLDSLEAIRVAHAALSTPLLCLFVALLVVSRGRALAPSSLRDGAIVALAPLAIAWVVWISPRASWAFIGKTSAQAQPRGFAFISTDRKSLERHDGFALYVDSSAVTVGGAGSLETIPLEPSGGCAERLQRVLTPILEEGFRAPALALARDATLPGIRCGVLGTLLSRGIRFEVPEGLPGAMPRFDSQSFDLVLQHGPDASDLPVPLDALAPHRGTTLVEIAPRPNWGRADRLHLEGAAWRFHSEGHDEQRVVGDDESRFAQVHARLSRGSVLEVSADSSVPAELVIRALLLPEAARLVLEAPPPAGLDGWTGPVVPPSGLRGTPKVRMGATSVTGKLPPEVIQRIVRQNYGRFRLCYEQGLGRNPSLEGRISVRFVIDRSGAVTNVANAGSDLADAEVVQCVIRAFYGLSFPQPESGLVTVTYPIMFSPG